MGILRNLMGFGPTPLDPYLNRNRPKNGDRWCPKCKGRTTVGLLDIFTCPKCKGCGRVPIKQKRGFF